MLPEDISDQYVVVVEGGADEELFSRLCSEAGIGSVVFDSPSEERHRGFGKDHFYAVLEALTVQRGFRSAKGIVLVQDSDDSCDSVLTNITGQIRKANRSIERQNQSYGIPRELLESAAGTETPSIMALSVPWIDEQGSIESLLLTPFEDKYPNIKTCVDGFVDCIGGIDNRSAAKKAKVRLSCFVAATLTKNPTAGIKQMLGSAECNSILSHSRFDQLRAFFANLDNYFS